MRVPGCTLVRRWHRWPGLLLAGVLAVAGSVVLSSGTSWASGSPGLRAYAHNANAAATISSTLSGDWVICALWSSSGSAAVSVVESGWTLWWSSGVISNYSAAIYYQVSAGGSLSCEGTPNNTEDEIFEFQNLQLSQVDDVSSGAGPVATGNAFSMPYTANYGSGEYAVGFFGWGSPGTCGSGFASIGYDSNGGACAGSVPLYTSAETVGFGSNTSWVDYYDITFDVTASGGAPTGATTTTTAGSGTTTTTSGGGGTTTTGCGLSSSSPCYSVIPTTTTTTDGDGGSLPLVGGSSGTGCDWLDPVCWMEALFVPSGSDVESFVNSFEDSSVAGYVTAAGDAFTGLYGAVFATYVGWCQNTDFSSTGIGDGGAVAWADDTYHNIGVVDGKFYWVAGDDFCWLAAEPTSDPTLSATAAQGNDFTAPTVSDIVTSVRTMTTFGVVIATVLFVVGTLRKYLVETQS